MTVELTVPDNVAQAYASQPGGLNRAATEALALEGVRSGVLTEYEAGLLLGIPSRHDLDGFLKAHGVYLPITVEDVVRDGEIALKFARR